jgi:hypothetical protein
MLQPDVGVTRAAELRPIGRAERLDRKARPPLRQQLELVGLRMAAVRRSAREQRRDHQPMQIQRVQFVATVLDGRGARQPQRRARRDHLAPRPREAGHGTARVLHRGARDVRGVRGRLHQHHAVPAVGRDAEDGAAFQYRRVRRLHRPAVVDEPGAPGVAAQEHGRVGVAREERVERGFVAGAK